MKHRNTIMICILTIAVSACGGKKSGSLEEKKGELAKLRKEINSLQERAKTLEAEIGKLDTAGAEGKLKLVEVLDIKPEVFRGFVEVQGTVDAEQSTIATAQMPGVVTRVAVAIGQQVSAGQILAEIDNSLIKQQVAQAQQQVDFLTTLYQKQKSLWEKGIGTEVQYLSAKNQKEAMEKNLAAANQQLNMSYIKSQISGTIESVDVKVGQTAAPGLPLFRVVNMSGVKVVTSVAETYVSKIHKGDLVNIHFPDLKKDKQGNITFVSRVIDPINRSFRCEARLQDATDLRPNMLAVLKVTDYEQKNAIAVPVNVIQNTGMGAELFVIENQHGNQWTARHRSVKTGRNSGDKVEILDGLKPGDRIITNGFQGLSDDQQVQIIE
ncbi:MAG: efflux RND transporter periplasmic adaptor subunit [Bacteroidetes bacterium]|nr:efflux RND transporter periplasmic adaptor subunit [Bacteroidota bacterium]